MEFLSIRKPGIQLIRIAKEIAGDLLPQPAISPERYGVAFVTIHEANLFNQLIFDWWERNNELRHHVFRADEAKTQFQNITATGEAFCVWELAILAFEREAWLKEVLGNPSKHSLQTYLKANLNTDA